MFQVKEGTNIDIPLKIQFQLATDKDELGDSSPNHPIW